MNGKTFKIQRIGNLGDSFEKGGSVEEGIDLFEDHDNIPQNVQDVLEKYAEGIEDGNYKQLAKANKELKKIGYTFEYGLDGGAYDLRPIGTKGKTEYLEKGGKITKGTIVEYKGDKRKIISIEEDSVTLSDIENHDIADIVVHKEKLNGSIPNNYKGKTAKEVWGAWSKKQRYHFIQDHFSSEDGPTRLGKTFERDADALLDWDYDKLQKSIKLNSKNGYRLCN